MRIISLNIWHGKRKQALRDFLLQEADRTDIFCFQEAGGDNADEVIDELLATGLFQSITAEKQVDADIYYQIYTLVKRHFQVERTYQLLNDSDASTGQALAVEVKAGDERVTIVNVHGVPYPGHKLDTEGRLRQTEEIIAALDVSMSVVVTGDFNLLPEARSTARFHEAGYRNLIVDWAIPTTRNRHVWERYPNNKQLFADYMFTSPSVTVRDFCVPTCEVSDHLPLLLEGVCTKAHESTVNPPSTSVVRQNHEDLVVQ